MEQQQQQRAMEQGLAEGYATPFQQQTQTQPRFSNKAEQQQAYISRARAASAAGASHAHAPRVWAAARDFGAAFGVGVGLYLRVLVWMKWMFLFLMLAAVPLLVTINNATYTDAVHQNSTEFGIQVYPEPQLSSFTFGAIVGPAMDNNTLAYMHINIASRWEGPMKKSTFLTWISYVDACASFLVLCGLAIMPWAARRFCSLVDRQCLEVSDFTVAVHGLPADAIPEQVGEHFARFGAIVEAQLVLDLGWVLHTCEQVTHLQQKLQLLEDKRLFGQPEEVYVKRAATLENQMQQCCDGVNGRLDKRQLSVKLAFVTYNDQASVQRCLNACPKGWVGSWFQPKTERFLAERRFWVERASPPEDYLYENLSVCRASKVGRKVLTRCVIALIFLLTAAAITGLSNYNNATSSYTLSWSRDKLYVDATAAVTSWLPRPPPLLRNAPSPPAGGVNATLVCRAALPDTCTPHFRGSFGQSLNLTFGSLLQWGNLTEGLLYQRPALKALHLAAVSAASLTSANATPYAACYPCLCLGLQQNPHNDSPAWRSFAAGQCAPYIDQYNLSTWGLSIAIALVITVLNLALKYALVGLLTFERHWTLSGLEWCYAWLAFAAQLLNSAVVLLLVNCSQLRDAASFTVNGTAVVNGTGTVDVAGAGIGAGAVGAEEEVQLVEQSSWFQYVMLSGQYSDFDQAWFETVGKSIWTLVAIAILNPFATLLCDVALQRVRRWRLLHRTKNDVQHRYDEAFARPDFSLQQRVADVLLGCTLAFMFGTGIPLLYMAAFLGLLVQLLMDRFCMVHVSQVSSRYSAELPNIIIRWLPWALLLHCCFGLWMYTYFPMEDNDSLSAAVLAGGSTLVSYLSSGTMKDVSRDNIAVRITQANGLPMLFVTILVAAYLVWRYLLWPFLRAPVCRAASALHSKLRACGKFTDLQFASDYNTDSGAAAEEETYDGALVSGALQGAPTYRVHHHPRYGRLFAASGLTRAVWYRATGVKAFTRLASCEVTGVFRVAPSVCTSLDTSDLRLSCSQVPSSLSHLVQDMQDKAVRGRNTTSSSGFTSSTDATSAASYRNQGSNSGFSTQQGSGGGTIPPVIAYPGSQPVQQQPLGPGQAAAGAYGEAGAGEASAPPLSMLLEEPRARFADDREQCDTQGQAAASVHIQVLAEGEPLPADWWAAATVTAGGTGGGGNGGADSAGGSRPGAGVEVRPGDRLANRQGFSLWRVRASASSHHGGQAQESSPSHGAASTPQPPGGVLGSSDPAGAPAQHQNASASSSSSAATSLPVTGSAGASVAVPVVGIAKANEPSSGRQ